MEARPMEAPALVFVPPTPTSELYPGPTPSPSSSATTTTISTLPDPPLDNERNSCETAIVTIYSMYGDREGTRGSWTGSSSDLNTPDVGIVHSKDIDLTLPDNYRNSFFLSRAYTNSNWASSDPPLPPPPTEKPTTTRSSTPSSYVSCASEAGPATPPKHSPPYHARELVGTPELNEIPSVQKPQDSAILVHSTSEFGLSSGVRPRSSHNRPPRSRPPSHHRNSELSHGEERPPPVPSPVIIPALQRSSSRMIPSTPVTPKRMPVKGLSNTSSPASQVSLEPHDGEDPDAFHVRSTYAQLEVHGVKGDGYEEGVERTRARVGASRASQLFAEDAVGDGTEKSRELDPKELETLSSLDRYGFFTIPSHDRLVLLTSSHLQKRLSRVTAGSSSASPSAQSLECLPPASVPPKEAPRITKWTRMLKPRTRDRGSNVETWSIKPSKEGKLRERTYKGIPDRWRFAAWELLMSRYSKTGAQEFLSLARDYRVALDKPSTYDIQIDLDVPRTISGHVMFRTRYGAGQRALFHVLHCLSLRCPSCGYVQGMGPLAATLLCYFDPERAYASLVHLHDAYSMHEIFSPGFPGLLEAIYVQERITEQMMPDVYAAFKKHTISTTSYATKWYITLFANSVPFQTQLRLWDVFLLEGQDVFVAVAIAIVWVYRDNITSGSANFETILSLLSSFFVPQDDNSLLSWVEKTLGDKKLRLNMGRWRDEWKLLVASGKDGTALL